ncbi:Uma2 family endonuclease [Hymenobacter baengnokdamensis]|uniref:Uma2 family endonuclease n=1 Tax=Hymenobacter baengnokdamensis TaxID=2615203 RepID=UPI001E48C2C0|nr:Uma2 family endonuclease [Hymenobacter baengnokdamensis]
MSIILPFAPDQELEPSTHMGMAERLQRMTEAEFFAFCQANSQLKFERLADGTISYMALTGGDTGRRNSELIADLTIWNRQSRLGRVFDSSTGFRLPSGAVRSPDAAWVSTAAWQALSESQRSKFPPLCPEFVVELLSASDSVEEMALKMQEYIANGCRLAWLLDPKAETARVYRADSSVSIAKSFEETLSGEDVLPGFSFALSLLR